MVATDHQVMLRGYPSRQVWWFDPSIGRAFLGWWRPVCPSLCCYLTDYLTLLTLFLSLSLSTPIWCMFFCVFLLLSMRSRTTRNLFIPTYNPENRLTLRKLRHLKSLTSRRLLLEDPSDIMLPKVCSYYIMYVCLWYIHYDAYFIGILSFVPMSLVTQAIVLESLYVNGTRFSRVFSPLATDIISPLCGFSFVAVVLKI